jgi:hypothetical protein
MRRLRQIHHWLGAFFAPAILFFTITGALQTFSLHESKGRTDYTPPKWIVVAASIHKDQALPHPRPHREKPKAAAIPTAPPAPDADHDDHDPDRAAPPAVAGPPATKPAGGYADHDAPRKAAPSPLPLKIFVLAVSIGLFFSTVLGLWIALKNRNQRRITLILLAAGTIAPIVLLFL